MKEATHKRQFLIILLIVFVGFLGISMPYLIFPALFMNPAYSILPETCGYTNKALLLGITLGAYPLGQFIGSPILGALSDDYGRKRLLAASLFLNALCNLVTGLALCWQQVELLIVSRFASGLMEGNIAIARAMANDLKSLNKHASFGRINAAASIAYVIGPFIGGLLADSNLYEGLTISTPFYVVFFIFVGLSAMSLLTLQDRPLQTINQNVLSIWQRFNLIKRLKTLFKNKRLKFLLIITTSFTIAVDIFYEFGPVYLTTKWLLDPVDLIIYNAVLCIGLAVGNGWLSAFVSTYTSKRQAIIGSVSAFTLLLIGTCFAESHFVMLLLFTAIGLAIGIAVTLLTVKISDSVSDEIQGEVMGVQVALRVLGDAVICILGGLLLLLSSKLVLAFAAVIAALSLLYYKRAS